MQSRRRGPGAQVGNFYATPMITGNLVRRAEQLAADRIPFVLATVVRALHPTSVRPGDSAIVLSDGSIEGFVGGVCAESSVRLHSLRVLETGEGLLLRLAPGNPDSGERQTPVDGTVLEHNPCLSGGSLEIFLDPHLPAPRILVLGTSPIAQAIERVAAAAGYDVGRGTAEELGTDPGDSALIVASHGAGEEHALSDALNAGVPYVALVASRQRGELVRAELEVPDELRSALHTPAGMAIGARSPDEIAISILAELVAEQRHGTGRARAASTPAVATDPVCGMEVAVSAASLSLQVGDQTFFFCGAGCRTAYAQLHADDVASR